MDGGVSVNPPMMRQPVSVSAAEARLSRHFGAAFATARLMAVIVPAPFPDTTMVCEGRLGESAFTAAIPPALIDALLLRHGIPANITNHPPPLRPLLIELLLEDDLLALEALPGAPRVRLDLIEPATGGPAPQGTIQIGLQCRLNDTQGDETFTVVLAVAEPALAVLDSLLQRLARPRRKLPNLPLGLTIERARVRVARAELRRAGPGDVIVAPGLAAGTAKLIAGMVWWPLVPRGNQWEVAGTMQKQTDSHALTGPGASPLDTLPVELCFEVGRLTRPLAEIEALHPGQVLILPDRDASQVSIIANGQVIGAGDIVSVGSEAGIRIRWIGEHDASNA